MIPIAETSRSRTGEEVNSNPRSMAPELMQPAAIPGPPESDRDGTRHVGGKGQPVKVSTST